MVQGGSGCQKLEFRSKKGRRGALIDVMRVEAFLESGSDGSFDLFEQVREGGRLVERQVGQNLPVEPDAQLFQPGNETAVADSLRPASRIDSLDPEAAELTLVGFSVAIGVGESLFNGMASRAVEARASAPVSFGQIKYLFSAGPGLRAAFNAWHLLSSLWCGIVLL